MRSEQWIDDVLSHKTRHHDLYEKLPVIDAMAKIVTLTSRGELAIVLDAYLSEFAVVLKQKKPMIFVFGSNEKGIHGGGAARVAREKYGANLGQGVGMQGRSYAIPTCALPTGMPNHEIPLEKVAGYVADFIRFAKDNPELEFQVTQIGCGLAGWKKEQIAPLFADAPDNCYFDTDWEPFLGSRKYWGHA